MPDDAMANAIFCYDRILARINDIRNILPVPSGASKKKNRFAQQHNPIINIFLCDKVLLNVNNIPQILIGKLKS